MVGNILNQVKFEPQHNRYMYFAFKKDCCAFIYKQDKDCKQNPPN